MWWRRGEQTLRTALWNGMNGVTFIVLSPSATCLQQLTPPRLAVYSRTDSAISTATRCIHIRYMLINSQYDPPSTAINRVDRSSSCFVGFSPSHSPLQSSSSCPIHPWKRNISTPAKRSSRSSDYAPIRWASSPASGDGTMSGRRFTISRPGAGFS